ncbi:MAG: hypothetical protein V1717_04315, partial [Candidatus Micrarchaeota archaeon]
MAAFNILEHGLVKREIATTVGDSWDVVIRPACLIVKRPVEDASVVKRLLLLPPGGFTSTTASLLSPHPEARWAKLEIKGGVRQEGRGFSRLKNCIRFSYYKTCDLSLSYGAPYVLM